MSRTLDVLAIEKHGTVEGYRAGCRGGNCPTGIEIGLSCAKANMLAAGNWQYLKAVRRGLTPAQIAAELNLTPAARTEKKKPARKDEPEDLEEEPMTTTPKPKKPGPSQAEVRIWAREQGLTVSNRGGIPRPIMDAYNARDKGVQASDVKPAVEVAPDPAEVVEDVEQPIPVAEATATAARPIDIWDLPLTSYDLRTIADALEKVEKVPLDIVDLDEIPVNRPGGADVIGHFRLAADFAGDEAWLGFVPLGGAA